MTAPTKAAHARGKTVSRHLPRLIPHALTAIRPTTSTARMIFIVVTALFLSVPFVRHNSQPTAKQRQRQARGKRWIKHNRHPRHSHPRADPQQLQGNTDYHQRRRELYPQTERHRKPATGEGWFDREVHQRVFRSEFEASLSHEMLANIRVHAPSAAAFASGLRIGVP